MKSFAGLPVTIDAEKYGGLLGAGWRRDEAGKLAGFVISPNLLKISPELKDAVLSHELGHLFNKHLHERSGLPKLHQELEADRFAARKGHAPSLIKVLKANNFLKQSRGVSTVDPIKDERIKALEHYISGIPYTPPVDHSIGSRDLNFDRTAPNKNWQKQLVSLDIETTNLEESKGRIWEAAFAREDGIQHAFIKPNGATKKEQSELFRASARESRFQRGQFAGFREHLKNFKGAMSEDDFVKYLGTQINQPSILLIQNANFENKWLSHMMEAHENQSDVEKMIGSSDKDKIAIDRTRSLEFVTQRGGIRGPKYFYTPPDITKQRWDMGTTFDRMFDNFRAGKDSDLKGYAEQAGHMISSYKKYFEDPDRKGTVVAEMMDFSKALYAEAAYQKHISPAALFSRTTNIEFLSQVFLGGEKESHRASQDAMQQLRIFKEVLGTYNELKSGTISDKSRGYLATLNRSLPASQDTSYLSGLRSALEELKNNGSFAIKDKLIRGDAKPILVTSPTYGNMTLQGKSNIPIGELKNFEDVVSFVGRRYKGTAADNSIKAISDARYTDIEAALKDVTERLDSSKENLSKLIGGIGPTIATEKPAAAIEFTRSMSKGTKAAIGVGLGVIGLYMLSGKPKEEPKEDKGPKGLSREIHKQGDVPNAVFRAYGYNKQAPVVYSGTGFYDWDNRTQHHVA